MNWKEKYCELLKIGDIISAFKLMKQNIPNYLYKYRDMNNKNLNALKDNYIWGDLLGNQNDSEEGLINLVYDSNINYTVESIININKIINEEMLNNNPFIPKNSLLNIIMKNQKEIDDYKNQLAEIETKMAKETNQKNYRCVCLTVSSDNDLMWKKYANNYTGFCIEYNTKDFSSDMIELLRPIIYDVAPKKTYHKSETKSICENIIASTTKRVNYMDEEEWRFLYTADKSAKFPMPKPRKIYLGKRFDLDKNLNLIKKSIDEKITKICYLN